MRKQVTRRDDDGPVPAISLLPAKLVAAIDKWAAQNAGKSRSEAIRRLLEKALSNGRPSHRGSRKSASKARALANREIDRLEDKSIPTDVREKRKRRLTKGPREFRDKSKN
jgi:metal-responsive CopG/Arc/MetJ family transcriptional regulator